MPPRHRLRVSLARAAAPACALAGALTLTLAFTLLACEEPPELPRVEPPPRADTKTEALAREAYAEALAEALPTVRAALISAEPLAAWQADLAGAASPPLQFAERRALERQLEAARDALGQVDESYLPGAEIVIVRAMRFAIARINDDLTRRPLARQDPAAGLRVVAAYLAELRYRLLQDDCDAACEALPAAMVEDVSRLRLELGAASVAGASHAAERSAALAAQARALASTALTAETPDLRAGLEQLAAALDDNGAWLAELAEALPGSAERHEWTAPAPKRAAGDIAKIERLPPAVGAAALVRLMSVEERVDLQLGPAFARIERHVRRWQAMRDKLVGDADPLAAQEATALDLPRCEAALARIRAGLEAVKELDAPRFDCARYLALVGDEPRRESELVLDIIDLGVTEPQRRAMRADELPEVALVTGQWSAEVHRHLRRIMILARLDEAAASAQALAEGRRALCWAEAALWIHGELGPAQEVGLTLGGPCAELGDAEAIAAAVSGDPRGTLAGFGLSLIGDEPARMVGFDRFFWAPLGLMKTLATPRGTHPDSFTLPDDPTPAPDPELQLKYEQLSPTPEGDPGVDR